MRRAWAVAGVCTLVLSLVGGQPAWAQDKAPRASTAERAVTLVTGDRVLVSTTSVRPLPGKGREHIRFALRQVDGHSYVVPSDAIAMLAKGSLDWRLFDVTGLVELGYDDARRADLPLIVRSRATVAPGAARTVRRLSTLNVSAVRAAKDAAFWTQVRQDPTARVWLDGVRQPLIDRSVPHIGAPAAWALGYTGVGVTVAVLDSGIDATHPDLVDRVIDARTFTEDEGPGDSIGHGTHVAGTIAGTGAASAGRFRGVAPGATLLDGKVCSFFACTESAILAGMEWAAVEKGAAVVNLSLGGPDQPGIDPVEEAVNRLTATHGTLFVISAGNVGRCSVKHRIGSPASAEAALSVGATDLADQLAPFSCQGPTVDGALKPDLTGPGVDIASARAPGTPVGDGAPVEEHYARASGTSMSAPHVAGAAALLAQQHPDWQADRLKAALMASAASHPTLTPYQQGAGRVDVARAIGQTVTTAPASLSLGRQRWPHTDDEPVVRTLTYRNSGPAEATLTVRLEVTGPTGAPAPPGMFALSATAVTVPAGGEASLTVTTNTRVVGPDGLYSGRVVATGGGITVGTPIGVDREAESYDVTIRALDRTGAPTELFIADVYTPEQAVFMESGGTIRLPRGEYDLAAFIFTMVPEPLGSLSLIGTHLTLAADTTVTFDSRVAKPVEVVAPRASARLVAGMIAATGVQETYSFTIGLQTRSTFDGLFSAHIGQSGHPTRFSGYVWSAWAEPGPSADFTNSPYVYNLAWYSRGRVFDGLVKRPREHDLAAVRSEYPTRTGGAATKADFARLPGVEGMSTIGVSLQFDLPATRIDYYTTDLEWLTEVRRGEFHGFTYQGITWRAYSRGAHEERWGVGVLGPSMPRQRPFPWQEDAVRQSPDSFMFLVPMFSGTSPSHFGDVGASTARTTLLRDGELVAESDQAGFIVYAAPSTAANLQVDSTLTQSVADTSTEVRATWRLRTRPVTDRDGVLLPAMAVRFRPTLDNANSAPGGRVGLLPVTVERQAGAAGAPITSLTIDMSSDDGQTWRRVPLVKTPIGWLAAVLNPTSGFVSLRARAVDADGNSVDQTIIRAYRLR